MKRHIIWLVAASLLLSWSLTALSDAPEPTRISPTPVDADPNKTFELTDADGPWMIFATSFAGEAAEQQAHDLILYLRTELELPAFVYKRHFDYSQPVVGRGLNRTGGAKQMQHAQAKKFDEFAVLVGNFESVDAPQLETSLQKIKDAQPPCLANSKHKQSVLPFSISDRFSHWRNADDVSRSQCPLGQAFVNARVDDENVARLMPYACRALDTELVGSNPRTVFWRSTLTPMALLTTDASFLVNSRNLQI